MNKQTKKMTISIIIIGIVSKVLGFTKGVLQASNIGCCFSTDSYFVAFMAATLIAEIIGEGISTSMVPVLLKIQAKEGKEKKLDYVNNLLNITILSSLVLITFSWLLSPIIVKVLARGFDEEAYKVTLDLMRLGLPMIFFIMVRAIFVAFLQSNHAFKAGAKSWIYYNIVYIVYLVIFSDYGTYGLMIAGIFASASQLIPTISASVDMGYKYKKVLNYKSVYLKEMIIIIIPMLLGLSINRVNLFIDNTVASSLPIRSISLLNYADDIIQLILGIFITAIATVLFPIISEKYNRGDMENVKKIINQGMGTIIKIVVPITMTLIVLSEPIVRALFERGAFGPESTVLTSEILVYYSLGLGSMALVLILTKIYYAMDDSVTPMKFAFIGVMTNLILNIVLAKYMGAKGIALATSLSTILVRVLLVTDLNKKINLIDIHKDMKSIRKLLISTAIMTATMLITFELLGKLAGNTINVIGSIGIGFLVYLGMNKFINQ